MDTADALTIAKGVTICGTHSFDGGFLIDVEEVKKQISNLKGQDGITLSGGEPFEQPKECLEIAKFCKNLGLNVWCYTGFTFKKLLEMSKTNKNILEFLGSIDVLVDGKYIEEQRSLNLLFKGSTNQKIIDVKTSIREGKIVEKILKENYFEENYGKKENLYI